MGVAVVGSTVGLAVEGTAVEGALEGAKEGVKEGAFVAVGALVVGFAVGLLVVGFAVGVLVFVWPRTAPGRLSSSSTHSSSRMFMVLRVFY